MTNGDVEIGDEIGEACFTKAPLAGLLLGISGLRWPTLRLLRRSDGRAPNGRAPLQPAEKSWPAGRIVAVGCCGVRNGRYSAGNGRYSAIQDVLVAE